RIVPDGDGYRCDLTLPLQYQGPPGRVHGGIVATLVDHLLGHAAALAGPARSMTRYLTINYDGGTPIGKPITVRGRVARHEGRKRFMEAEVVCDGEVCVRAEGLWILPRTA
ncbi:MAG TPA: PaaI family thioesterase, partial [Brevibacterium senegalense]|nr:PaaI family thioesterase [Brevibacterium senegalense]